MDVVCLEIAPHLDLLGSQFMPGQEYYVDFTPADSQ